MATILSIWRNEGFAALFRGLEPELTQGVLSAAVMMMVKEQVCFFIGLLLLFRGYSKVLIGCLELSVVAMPIVNEKVRLAVKYSV